MRSKGNNLSKHRTVPSVHQGPAGREVDRDLDNSWAWTRFEILPSGVFERLLTELVFFP